ncbi:MAG: hypothetical protein RBR32_04590 [Bacteroidales bacterium]|jgi:hypothetical protein|nr:hypothetical protein [Bacteroidales bacterium]
MDFVLSYKRLSQVNIQEKCTTFIHQNYTNKIELVQILKLEPILG